MGSISWGQFGKSKVRYLSAEIVHEKNVRGFDVPVDDRLICIGEIYGSASNC
jgi:hypothetical protein